MNHKIKCPACDWEPDGNPYWQCTCGHSWNTFETKGKCPSCQTQWANTYCLGCGKTSPHTSWYVDPTADKLADTAEEAELKARKKRIERRLINLGIKNYRISYLPGLDLKAVEFVSPYEAGCRLIILYYLAYCVQNLDDRQAIIDWFKKEGLWEKVSENEMEFLLSKDPEEGIMVDLSWRIEATFCLGWALNLVDKLPEIDETESEAEMDQLLGNMPELGGLTEDYLQGLKYREKGEIFEENLVNEIATTYFRDLLFNGNPDETIINRSVSFERHRALNWVRKFSPDGDWDQTDTST